MRIAITATRSSLDAPMEEQFERCTCFVVADLGGALHDSVHHPGRKRRPGPGVHVSNLLVDRGVSVVLTGRCDPKTFEQLASAGLWVVTGCDGNVRQVLERFTAEINGQLTCDPGYSSAGGKNPGGFVPEPRAVVGGEGRRGRRRERRIAHGHEAGGGGPWYQERLGRL